MYKYLKKYIKILKCVDCVRLEDFEVLDIHNPSLYEFSFKFM